MISEPTACTTVAPQTIPDQYIDTGAGQRTSTKMGANCGLVRKYTVMEAINSSGISISPALSSLSSPLSLPLSP